MLARCALLAFVTALPLAAQETDGLVLGFVRADGLLIPFATFEAGQWDDLDVWPDAEGTEWHYYGLDEGTAPLQVGAEVDYATCFGGRGFATSRSPVPHPRGCPTPLVGIAATVDLAALPFADAAGTTRARLHETIRGDLERARTSIGASSDASLEALAREVSAADTTGLRFWEATAAQQSGERGVEYVDATAYYPNGTVHLDRWFVDGQRASGAAHLAELDAKTTESIRPTFVLDLNGRRFVVAAIGGWESRRMEVFEVTGTEFVPQLGEYCDACQRGY